MFKKNTAYTSQFFTFEKIFGGIFLSIGLLFVCIAIGVGWHQLTSTRDWIKSTGTVVGYRDYSRTSTTVVVEYTTHSGNKSTFSPNFGSNPPLYDVGETVEIMMHPSDENQEPQLNNIFVTWLLPGIFGFIGSIFSVIGGGTIAWHLKTLHNTQWAQQHGQAVEAQYTSVNQKTNIKWNGSSPFVVVAQWHDTHSNTVSVFESEHLWYDPSQFLKNKQPITVFIDPFNPDGRYWMDISFLPEKAT